jgi:hypothetical protein
MERLNVAVSTKITMHEYQLLKQVAQAKFENGDIREPTVSRLLRVWIRGKLKKWRENSPVITNNEDIRSCYYMSGAT